MVREDVKYYRKANIFLPVISAHTLWLKSVESI